MNRATLSHPQPQFAFRPHIAEHLYEVRSEAVCRNSILPPHQPPLSECHSCGFYALESKRTVVEMGFSGGAVFSVMASSVVLEVALFGTVIEGPHGVRASHQRVDAVELEPQCSHCSEPASVLSPGVRLSVTDRDPTSGKPFRKPTPWYACDSRCMHHLSPTPGGGRFFSPAELATSLGVDVSWGSQVGVTELIRPERRP